MPPNQHNFGPECRLASVAHPERSPGDGDEEPPVAAQFFYSSAIPIDDPLSPAILSAASADPKATKGLMRPFSVGDNNSLEGAWLSLSSPKSRRSHSLAFREQATEPVGPEAIGRADEADSLARIIDQLASRHLEKHGPNTLLLGPLLQGAELVRDGPLPPCCAELPVESSNALRNAFCGLTRQRKETMSQANVVQEVMRSIQEARLRPISDAPIDVSSPSKSRPRGLSRLTGDINPKDAVLEGEGPSMDNSTPQPIVGARPKKPIADLASDGSRPATPKSIASTPVRPPILDDGISGKPFVRVGESVATLQQSRALAEAVADASNQRPDQVGCIAEAGGAPETAGQVPGDLQADQNVTELNEGTKGTAEILVGISRLHKVSLPLLQMKPIYWSPLNDIAIVTRATWFYKDSMIPIEPAVANQLEAGYRELRAYSETWSDELRCAVQVGPPGEEKVSHRLWPKDFDKGRKDDDLPGQPPISADPYCAAHCFQGEAAAEGTIDPVPITQDIEARSTKPRRFSNYHVIYKNGKDAFILKPSLKPSAYYGRRPVAKIMKGLVVGIPVVRGFDRKAWDDIHDKNKTDQERTSNTPLAVAFSADCPGHGPCQGCAADEERGKVTDLVLVAHGIGQKFAERVESFHFTHAINGFRRAINIELRSEAVKNVLRPGQNGIMVLPVNWRHTLSFEDGGPMKEEDRARYRHEGFGLKDIEPRTIPHVRSMMSDVMFDIPFYMSHHKPKMIQALVGEANRVYRLWCRNNPGFAETGRVHLIGHSLGSAMAIEVLSKQPTKVPSLDLGTPLPQTTRFEFDTENLFLLGSPAGFFLLLERGNLIPRRGRMKAGADPADSTARNVVADAGTFGCLAVDNIYNVLAREDPIAYFLNGTIDPLYARGLRPAYIPSASQTLFQSIGDTVRGLIPGAGGAGGVTSATVARDAAGAAAAATVAAAAATSGGGSGNTTDQAEPANIAPKPAPTARLPSQLELEVHDFTREEVAERKAYLLNDNGQVDYFLRSGGGPLEIQYLNMLSAHTSYWTNQDLIRMICIEIGRRPGRANTLTSMRAVKVARRVIPIR